MLEVLEKYMIFSGGSRISHWGGCQPVRGADLQHRCFLVKTYAKMKELVPPGEHALVGPSRSTNDVPVHITRFVTVTMSTSVMV